MLLATMALGLSVGPSLQITHTYTGKEARAIERAASLLQRIQPALLQAFELTLAGHRELRLEPKGACAHLDLAPFVPQPPYSPSSRATVVNPCDAFFRRTPDEAAVVLGLEMLYVAGLPDIRDGEGRRQDTSAVSARIRGLLPGHGKPGQVGVLTLTHSTLSGTDARVVHDIRDRAIRRLQRPGCLALLGDFVDEDGRSLTENLARLSVTADEYLSGIELLDGSGHRLCDTRQSQLVTTPGARRIFVCKAFVAAARSQPYEAELCLIHDMLHTLGLGENPPTSKEITMQVRRRCPFEQK
jgi:hypothetical protein